MTEEEVIVEMENVTKTFPGVTALDEVNFEVKKGEVHALCGENGAGKSTLMKVLSGIHSPNQGKIIYQEEEVELAGPLDAKQKGIILIHQELSLVPELSVAENIFLGDLPRNQLGIVDWAKLNQMAQEVLADLGADLSPTSLIEDLSVAQRQMVEVARGLTGETNLVIFDEPTASLTQEEEKTLFENIRQLRDQGTAVVYISHKLEEIFKVSNRVTVLRDGQRTGTLITSETDEDEITSLMIGRDIENYFHSDITTQRSDEEALRVEGLTNYGEFKDVSFSVNKGEVVGLSGLVGAGRTELAETIFGVREKDKGKIYIEGEEVTINHPTEAVNLRIGLLPEDRKEAGLIVSRSVKENLTLPKLRDLNDGGFVRLDEEEEIYQEYKDQLSIVVTNPDRPAEKLSGGNQQKVVIAKWLAVDPEILILDEPTRGIDVGTKAEIHKLIRELAQAGIAVLMISSEMPEIVGVPDRVLTMYHGQITGEYVGEEIKEDNLITGITGASDKDSA